MPDKIEPVRDPSGLRIAYLRYNNNNSDRVTYNWNGRLLDSVALRNGKVVKYEYYPGGKLKARILKNDLHDPGVREEFSATGWPEGTFTVTVGSTVTEEYIFSNAKLIEFSKQQSRYIVSDEGLATIVETVTLPPGGGAGPPSRFLKHVYLYDKFAKPIFVLDETLNVSNEQPLPKFLCWGQYYDQQTELYFLFNNSWYHPGVQQSLSNDFVPWIIPKPWVDPVKEYGYIRRPPTTFNYRYMKEQFYKEQEARISGTLRTVSGVVFMVVSVPLIASGKGAIIGIPLALWSADQVGTGISEMIENRPFTSQGGQAIQHVAGDGTVGVLLTMGYDMGPDAIMGLKSVVSSMRNLGKVSIKDANDLQRAYLARSLDEVAARNTINRSSAGARAGEDLITPPHVTHEQATIVTQALERAVKAIPDEPLLAANKMGVEAAKAPEYVARRILELRSFLNTHFPGPAGDPYTFAVWALPPKNGLSRIVIALNNPLKGIPFSEFPARGIVKPNEIFVYSIAKADAEATAIFHFPGNAIGGATRAACGSCTGLMVRNNVHPIVPYRYLGVNPSIKSGNPGMVQFLRTHSGFSDDFLRTLSKSDLEYLRDRLILQYRTGKRHGGRFRILK